MSYEFLEHTADIIVRAIGKDLKEAFTQGALGFYDVITNIEAIEEKIIHEVKIKSEDLESLLFDWINQLIYLFDTELFISNNIQIVKMAKNDNGQYELIAELKGEEFDKTKHPPESEVKAMTYSFMKINEQSVEFTLDL
ncbi:MAG: archease [Candidatus Heimdallarchaeota archaeon]|nr:archease [Candidatus Heimdallarchaeota archaeon]